MHPAVLQGTGGRAAGWAALRWSQPDPASSATETMHVQQPAFLWCLVLYLLFSLVLLMPQLTAALS